MAKKYLDRLAAMVDETTPKTLHGAELECRHYGWHRICEPGMTRRTTVHGAGFDNEIGKQITEREACRADSYPRETAWETSHPSAKPAYRLFHHKDDGIHDLSCNNKVGTFLRQHGYPEAPAFIVGGEGRRGLVNHLWQEAYNPLSAGQVSDIGPPIEFHDRALRLIARRERLSMRRSRVRRRRHWAVPSR